MQRTVEAQLCGGTYRLAQPLQLPAEDAVPPAWVYTRFLHKLMARQG